MAHDMLHLTHKGLFTNYVSHIWGGGLDPPPLSVIFSNWLTPPLSAMSAFGYPSPFPSFRPFLTRKISKYIYLKQSKALLVIHSSSNRE